MYAIIETGGKQYKVSEGDLVAVEKLDLNEGEEVIFDKVLFVESDQIKVGTPTVENANVKATIKEQGKEAKVIAFKYKPKKGYAKKKGHRQPYTLVEINSINA
ncbi:MAG: 50S ribosomal protein L21 [Peptoniphilaceae bacterium]|nr:50S ribosomal protein L21 [Peptoniphilaceae bacterium]MDD7383472.1 50S ribosomal protein L21 [Peptoniphilaceae bacterium]MDY3738466.1 50S ribosomal protein L21 [Peptoniphilaceae bacterium]